MTIELFELQDDYTIKLFIGKFYKVLESKLTKTTKIVHFTQNIDILRRALDNCVC